jgi:hypothetical protein
MDFWNLHGTPTADDGLTAASRVTWCLHRWLFLTLSRTGYSTDISTAERNGPPGKFSCDRYCEQVGTFRAVRPWPWPCAQRAAGHDRNPRKGENGLQYACLVVVNRNWPYGVVQNAEYLAVHRIRPCHASSTARDGIAQHPSLNGHAMSIRACAL